MLLQTQELSEQEYNLFFTELLTSANNYENFEQH